MDMEPKRDFIVVERQLVEKIWPVLQVLLNYMI